MPMMEPVSLTIAVLAIVARLAMFVPRRSKRESFQAD
jgi:hypothetical protein